jgi:hypothetical protein
MWRSRPSLAGEQERSMADQDLIPPEQFEKAPAIDCCIDQSEPHGERPISSAEGKHLKASRLASMSRESRLACSGLIYFGVPSRKKLCLNE